MKKDSFDVVVLYSSGHLGSAAILNRLVEMSEFEVKGIIKSQAIPFTAKGLKKLNTHLKKVGWRFAWLLLWQRCVQGFFYALSFAFVRNRLKASREIAYQKDITVLDVDNVNNENTINFLSSIKPDLLISIYFPKILKKEIIDIPLKGVLNIHPGWLPAYKGAMTYFWALKNGQENAGVTLHWIDEGIDTGEIIAREAFEISQGMTQQTALDQTAVIGSRMLQDAAKLLLSGQALEKVELDESEPDQYYPMPGEKEFDEYFAQKRFFRIRDIFKLIFRSP